MRICVLGSGSRGNAVFVAAGQTRVLVDAGFSTLSLKKRLASIGEDITELTGVVISHEHIDHVNALPVLTKRIKVPILMTRGTAEGLRKRREIQGIECFEAGDELNLGDLTLRSFSVSHDASDPVGFVINNGDHAVGIATDLGVATGLVRERLKGLDALVIEANHDPAMLIDGPYPWELKQRIQSRVGHLANQATSKLVSQVGHRGLKHVLLAHLSESNNTPQLASDEVRQALDGTKTKLHVTCQALPGACIRLK